MRIFAHHLHIPVFYGPPFITFCRKRIAFNIPNGPPLHDVSNNSQAATQVKTTSQSRFDMIMTLESYHVSSDIDVKSATRFYFTITSFLNLMASFHGYCQVALSSTTVKILYSYTLSREYRVVRNRYSRLLFTSEDRLCANLHMQEQSTNMTSQCQSPTFAWRNRSNVVTSQC